MPPPSELARVFYLELDLARVMRVQKARLEDALGHLSEYTRQVDKMYANENCPEGDCAREVMMEKIVGNPIYSYQGGDSIALFGTRKMD